MSEWRRFHYAVGEFCSEVYKTCNETRLALSAIITQKFRPVWLEGRFLVSRNGQNPAPVAFPSRQEEHSWSAHFSHLGAILSECMSVQCVVSVRFFCWKPKISSKATDKATAGGRVAEWRGEGRKRRGLLRAQCLPSSRCSTLKKRLINRNLIGWRGHTCPLTDTGQASRTPAHCRKG